MKKCQKVIIISLSICIILASVLILTQCNKKDFIYNVGDEVTLGRYYYKENDNFRSNDITWIVIKADDQTVTLISKDILDWMPYSEDEYKISSENIWSESDIRNILNNDFYKSALKNDSSIIKTEQTLNKTDGSNKKIYDNVFLLNENNLPENDTWIKAKPTPYAISKGATVNNEGYSKWWLMPESGDSSVGYVTENGNVKYEELQETENTYSYGSNGYGIRPVITIPQEYWQKVSLGKVNVQVD